MSIYVLVAYLGLSSIGLTKATNLGQQHQVGFEYYHDPNLFDSFASFYPSSPLGSVSELNFWSNMATVQKPPVLWHDGEKAVQKLLLAPSLIHANPSARGMTPSYNYRVANSPLVAFGALDEKGRPWTTVWGGERGFTRPIAQNILGAQSVVDRMYDPVVKALVGSAPVGDLVRPEEDGPPKLMAGLSIDLETRDRVKLMGKMIVGALMPQPSVDGKDDGTIGEMQVAMAVQESLGNCPKYLNKKEIYPHIPTPKLASHSLPLPQAALDLIENADLFFLSSTNGESMDTNHRGGPQGFIRVLSNSPEDLSIVYPEFSGNNLYQTLGNLHLNPKIGIAIPDFDTSDVLYLTGETQLLAGPNASAVLPHTKLAVKIRVEEALFVQDGLPFRGRRGEPSPYNPPVRRLAIESTGDDGADGSAAPIATAHLVRREILTPSISRFTFELTPEPRAAAVKPWAPGQHVTFDFSKELDAGYSHMRDDDPTSLNDDFIRTFTVSNVAPPTSTEGGDDAAAVLPKDAHVEITLRRHGPATGLLWRHNMRVPLELPVLGFGGDESFRMPTTTTTDATGGERPVFVAGGVGITPLLAQAAGVLAAEPEGASKETGLRVLWSLRGEDVALALDVFGRTPGLAPRTHLFLTGTSTDEKRVDEARQLGAEITMGRLSKGSLLAASEGAEKRTKFYVCTGPELYKLLSTWLEGQSVVSENFNY